MSNLEMDQMFIRMQSSIARHMFEVIHYPENEGKTVEEVLLSMFPEESQRNVVRFYQKTFTGMPIASFVTAMVTSVEEGDMESVLGIIREFHNRAMPAADDTSEYVKWLNQLDAEDSSTMMAYHVHARFALMALVSEQMTEAGRDHVTHTATLLNPELAAVMNINKTPVAEAPKSVN